MRVSVVATGIDAASMAISAGRGQHVAAPAAAPISNPAPAFGLPGIKRSAALGGAGTSRPVGYHGTLVESPIAPQPLAAVASGGSAAASMLNQPVTSTATARAYAHEVEMAAEPMPADPKAAANAAAAVRAALGGSSSEQPQSRSAGPLRGERRDGSFIAPRPVDPGPRQPASTAPAAIPETQGAERPRKRSLSLFERVTGLGWRGREEVEAEVEEEAPVQSRAQPTLQAPAKPAASSRPGEGAKPSRSEEDVLDIPAFLRRQAN